MKLRIKSALTQNAKCRTLKSSLLIKTSLVLICLFQLSFIAPLKAQDTSVPVAAPLPGFHRAEFGFRFMPTISNFQMKTSSGGTVKGEATFGYGIGGMTAFNFTNHMGMQVELTYNSLSQKYKDQELDREINVRYLNIPVLFSLNTGKSNPVNLNAVLGPQLGFNMGSSIKKTGGGGSDTVTYVLATKRSDVSVAYGVGLEFLLNQTRTIRLDLGFRGVYGLVNINKEQKNSEGGTTYYPDQAKVRTKAMYLGISFLF